MDIQQSEEWVGNVAVQRDTVTATPVAALAATLDRDNIWLEQGIPVPPPGHWLYFLPIHRQSQVGKDGHPSRGGFLPPVPLPR
jgi:3-methylfumaryl-CoA hydratase